MSRQLEQEWELKQETRRDHLYRACEFGIVGGLQAQGIELRGFAIKYSEADCLLTVKAKIGDGYVVAFVSSDTITNCILKAEHEARHNAFRWKADQYLPTIG